MTRKTTNEKRSQIPNASAVMASTTTGQKLTFEGAHVSQVDARDVADGAQVARQRELSAAVQVLLLDAGQPGNQRRRDLAQDSGCRSVSELVASCAHPQ